MNKREPLLKLLTSLLLVVFVSGCVVPRMQELKDGYVRKDITVSVAAANQSLTQRVENMRWNTGAEDCSTYVEPLIDVLRVDESTYILRQNRCVHYEAPFIYLFFGNEKLFLQDTGATADEKYFPLYETVFELAENYYGKRLADIQWLVTHSHGHGDHKAADVQFRNKPNVDLVEALLADVQAKFQFDNWPEGESIIDLGGRQLTVFPIPGHHEESIAVYDSHSRWLLTGDTFYPGRLYIREWQVFQQSISKLYQFTQSHPVTALMGTHIEMSRVAGEDYKLGSQYQPEELPLPLSVEDLRALQQSLTEMGSEPQKKALDKVIIYPLN